MSSVVFPEESEVLRDIDVKVAVQKIKVTIICH